MQPVVARRGAGRRRGKFVGQFDRLAEVGGGLLERRAAQGLIARLAPPFDRRLVETGLGQMVGNELRLGGGNRHKFSTQGIGDLPVQDLPPAPEQGFVGRVLDQRVLEGVARIGRRARAEEQLRLFELHQGRAQRRLLAAGNRAQQRVGEFAADRGTDLCHLLDRRQPIKTRRQ